MCCWEILHPQRKAAARYRETEPLAECKDQSADGGGSFMVKVEDVAEARSRGTSVCVCVCYTGFTSSVNEGQMVTFHKKTLDTSQAATWSTRPEQLDAGGQQGCSNPLF